MLRKLLLSAAAIFVVSMPATAKADGASIPLNAISSQNGNALSIDIPALQGFRPSSAALSIVFRGAGQGWADAKRNNLSLAVADSGRIIAETDLSPDRWTYELPLPSIPSGAHLRAALIDHAGACSPVPLADLIDASASRLEVVSAPQAIQLNAIPALLGTAFPADRPLEILSPHGLDGEERLTAALQITENFALSYAGTVPAVQVMKLHPASLRQPGPLPGADTSMLNGPLSVLIGTIDDLDGWVSEDILAEVKGPYIRLAALPGSPAKWFLIVSGKSRQDLTIASHAFVDKTFTWPAGQAVILADDGVARPEARLPGAIWGPDHASRKPVTSSFADLGYPTREGASKISLPIVALAGADEVDPNARISINPSFVYAPGYLPGASIQAFIDGKFMGSVPLSPSGGDTSGSAITIPVKDLRQGVSTLTLIPALPRPADTCIGDSEQVPSTWRGDGSIETPWIGGGKIRASLSAWSATGHLNPAAADRQIRMVVESSSDQTVAAALTIAARMVKAAQSPLPGLTLAQSNQGAMDADLIMIGTHAWTAANLRPKQSGNSGEYPEWLARTMDFTQQTFSAGDGREQVLAHLAADPEAGRSTIVFGWSLREGQSVVAAAFPDEEHILKNARRLVSEDTWSKLAGDYLVMPASGAPAYSKAVANPDSTAAASDPDPFARIHAWTQDAARTAQGRVGLVIFATIFLLAIAMRLLVSNDRVRKAERR